MFASATPMFAFLGRLLRDNRGTSLIETSIITPVLALLVIVGVETASGVQEQLRVQQAADRAANFALTAGMTVATTSLIQSEAATAANISVSNVTVNKWLECNSVTQSLFTATCSSGVSPARYVSVAIADTYTPRFAAMLYVSSIPLRGYAQVRIQ